MGMETVVFGLAAIGGICLGITLIGLTICVWVLIYNVMRNLFRQTPKRFEIVRDEKDEREEKKTATSTRRNRTETTNN